MARSRRLGVTARQRASALGAVRPSRALMPAPPRCKCRKSRQSAVLPCSERLLLRVRLCLPGSHIMQRKSNAPPPCRDLQSKIRLCHTHPSNPPPTPPKSRASPPTRYRSTELRRDRPPQGSPNAQHRAPKAQAPRAQSPSTARREPKHRAPNAQHRSPKHRAPNAQAPRNTRNAVRTHGFERTPPSRAWAAIILGLS
jgi:hypothetical protein